MNGYIDKNFREGMSRAECFEFIKEAISLATYRDGSSGGCVRIVDITAEGVKRELIPYHEREFR